MKTVLQICPRLNGGGIERGVVEVATACASAGFRSMVASGGGYRVAELERAGVTHVTLPLYKKSPFSMRKNARLLQELVAAESIDLIHARSRAPIWSAVMAKKKLSIPLITGCHGLHDAGPLGLKRLYNRCVALGDQVVVNSHCVADYVQQEFSCEMSKVNVIHRGVDVAYWQQVASVEEQRALSDVLPKEKPIILMPGRITRWKGQIVLLQAFIQLASETDAVLVFAGRVDSEDYATELHTLVSDHQLSSRVFFLGECNFMRALYQAAAVTVSASIEPEAFGRIAIEAQAAGSIMCASNIGGTKETIVPNETGFVFTAGSVSDLVSQLKKVLNLDDDERALIKQRSDEHIRNHFTLEVMQNKVLALYRSVL